MDDDRWLLLCARARRAAPPALPTIPVQAWRVGPSPQVREARHHAWHAAVLWVALLLVAPLAGRLAQVLPAVLPTAPPRLASSVGLTVNASGSVLPEILGHDH